MYQSNNTLSVLITLAISFGLILTSIVAVVTIGSFQGYGHGSQTGYVTAVEQYGAIWKTYRVYVKSDLASSQEDVYCVLDPLVVDELQDASRDRKLVRLNYTDQGITFKWECGAEESTITSIDWIDSV